jgi:AcrR family transcriptional regulator
MNQKMSTPCSSRMSREGWLEAALDYIARHGWARLRIRDLCANLGVTTGSFYAHFDGRDDFVQSVVEFWKVKSTSDIVEEIRNAAGDPRSRLIALAQKIIEWDLNGLDPVVRAWVARESALEPVVRGANDRCKRGLPCDPRPDDRVKSVEFPFDDFLPQGDQSGPRVAGRVSDLRKDVVGGLHLPELNHALHEVVTAIEVRVEAPGRHA